MADPSYAEMQKVLAEQLDPALCGTSEATSKFLVQAYFLLKRLVSDVQQIQTQLAEMNDFPQYKPGVN